MSHAGFVYRERVRFGDLDAMRHVSNVVFLRYFETAWISYRQTLGLLEGDLFAESETGFGLILAEAHIRYRSPVQFDEDLDIALTISDIRRSSFGVAFEMQVGDRLCAEGNLCTWDSTTGSIGPRRFLSHGGRPSKPPGFRSRALRWRAASPGA